MLRFLLEGLWLLEAALSVQMEKYVCLYDNLHAFLIFLGS